MTTRQKAERPLFRCGGFGWAQIIWGFGGLAGLVAVTIPPYEFFIAEDLDRIRLAATNPLLIPIYLGGLAYIFAGVLWIWGSWAARVVTLCAALLTWNIVASFSVFALVTELADDDWRWPTLVLLLAALHIFGNLIFPVTSFLMRPVGRRESGKT